MAISRAAVDSLFTRVDKMDQQEFDSLPHGAIQLDATGKVLKYNEYESRLAHLDKQNVIGKNFFTEVAPCTDVQEFHGRFKRGVAEKDLHVKFRYHFSFKINPRDVTVTLFYSDITHTVWVFIQPLN